MTSDEIRETFLSFFEQRGHLRVPSASLVPAPDDTSTLLTVAGHAAVQALLRGPRGAAGARVCDLLAALLSHPRHRGGRQHQAPPHLLRDARQLLVRRLLQGRVDALRLGALARGLRLRPGADLGHGVRRRRGARARPRHRGDRDLARDRRARRADRPAAALGELLAGGARPAPAGRARRCTSTAARSSAATTCAPATTPTATSSTGTTSS